MTEPYFYSLAHVQGAGIAADVLDSEYPFGLPAAEIVERLLAAGCRPAVERMQRMPFKQYGTITELLRDDRMFLVAVSRDAELISVQEVCAKAYPPE